jgi:hypothetical protein
MSLLWLDGFEWLGTNVDNYIAGSRFSKKYVSAPNEGYVRLRSGRTGGYAVEPAYSYAFGLYTPTFSAASDTYVVGFGLRPYPSFASGSINLLLFRKGTYSGITLQYTYPTKELLVLNRSGVQIGTTARANLDRGTWNYVEVKVKDAVAGEVTILVNGYEVCVLTNVDTTTSNGVGYDNCIFTLGNNSNYGLGLDDLYILNAAGDSNNDFLGDVQIRAIWPTSDGDLAEWGLSAGTDHYALVDDNPLTDDTDYTTADGTVSDLFGYGDASDLGTIHAIQINSCMREMTTAVVPTMKNLVKSNGTVYEQTVPAVTTSYKTLYNINETDPATAEAWTLANLNAAQFGVKRV